MKRSSPTPTRASDHAAHRLALTLLVVAGVFASARAGSHAVAQPLSATPPTRSAEPVAPAWSWSTSDRGAWYQAMTVVVGAPGHPMPELSTDANRSQFRRVIDDVRVAICDPSLTRTARRERMALAAESLQSFEPTMPSAEAARRLLLAAVLIRRAESADPHTGPATLEEATRDEAAELIASVIDLPAGVDAKRTIESDIRSVAVLLAVRFPALGVRKAEPIATALNASVAWAMPLAVARTAAAMDQLAPAADAKEIEKAAAPLLEILDRADLGTNRLFDVIRETNRFTSRRADDVLPDFAKVCRASQLLSGDKSEEVRSASILRPLLCVEVPPRLHPVLMSEALHAGAVSLSATKDLRDLRWAMRFAQRLASEKPPGPRGLRGAQFCFALPTLAYEATKDKPIDAQSAELLDAALDCAAAGIDSPVATGLTPRERSYLLAAWCILSGRRPHRISPDELARSVDRLAVAAAADAGYSVKLRGFALEHLGGGIADAARSQEPNRVRAMAFKANELASKHEFLQGAVTRHAVRIAAVDALLSQGLAADALPMMTETCTAILSDPAAPLDMAQSARLLLARCQRLQGQTEAAALALLSLTAELDAIVQPTATQFELRMSAWAVLLDLWSKDPKKHADALLRIRTLRAADPTLGGQATKAAIDAIEKRLTTP